MEERQELKNVKAWGSDGARSTKKDPSTSSTKVVPVDSSTGKAEAGNPFAKRSSTSGFHYQQSKLMRQAVNGSRMVGGKPPHDQEKYLSYEATEYQVPDTAKYEGVLMQDTQAARARRRWFLWFLYFTIGISVSLAIFAILKVCGIIEKMRVKATTKHLEKGKIGYAYMTWVGSSLVLTMFATALVLVQPAAASSGIPGLIAYLNGVKPFGGVSHVSGKPTSFISIKTMMAKLIGMIASIPSGLCIGPEGPIIHISALLALWTATFVQWAKRKLKCGSPMDHVEKSEQRDFLATGAACGICTAFRAPLAGTLFVVEEAASFFTTRHLEFTFFACLAAYWCQWAVGYQIDGEDASLSKFQQTTGFFCNLDNPLNMIFYICLAVIGGCVGALFNQIVEHLNHHRAAVINRHGWMRVVEVIVLTVLTGSAAVLMPAMSNCARSDRNLLMKDSAGCLSAKDFYKISYGTLSYSHLAENNATDYLEQKKASANNCSLTKQGIKLEKTLKYQKKEKKEHDLVLLDTYDGEDIELYYHHSYTCDSMKEYKNSTHYNDMSMLWLNGGVAGVKVLMKRGYPHLISASTLALFFVAYFVLAALTAGSHIPAGLVVPMMLIGGSMGRLVGLLALEMKKSICETYVSVDESCSMDITYWSQSYRWMIRDCKLPDPGTYAVIGMASFMGGSGRITVMLATVILELTADADMIAPVGITCVIAMLIGNMFNHGLYHGLIPIMNIPYLNARPAPIMFVSRVRDIMNDKIVWLPQHCHIGELKMLVKRIEKAKGDPHHVSHHAFPVVTSSDCQELQGCISRTAIYQCVKEYSDSVRRRIITHPTTNRIDLSHYMDRGPLTVFPHTTVARAYSLFRKLGLRHLPVVARDGTICGMVTRKDLMLFKLVAQHERELQYVIFLQKLARRQLKANGFYARTGIKMSPDGYSEKQSDHDIMAL